MSEVNLLVNGQAYGGWTDVSVTRGIESIAGRFSLEVSERWNGQVEPWPIREEDECLVTIGDEALVTGFIDERRHAFDAESHALGVSGRDKTGVLVDCSAILPQKEFLKLPALDICSRVAGEFGITVRLQDGLTDRAISLRSAKSSGSPGGVGSAGRSSSMSLSNPIAKETINPGDSAFEVIDRVCRRVGVLPVSDGQGGLVLTRAGGAQATTSLVEGTNIVAGEFTSDCTRRYRRYVVSGQSAGDDLMNGATVAAVSGEATDQEVKRSNRVLLIRPDGAVTREFARQRAAWEATVRRARSISVRVTVQGWQQGDGTLWPVNAIVAVKSGKLGIDGPMLITEATYRRSVTSGTTTELQLVAPDAFIPEPLIVPPAKGSSTVFLQ